MRKYLARLLGSLFFFSSLCLAAELPLTAKTVNHIIQQQFGEDFELLPVKPAFVRAKLQPDGRQDLIAVVRLKRANPDAKIPEGVVVEAPYYIKTPTPAAYWAEFIAQNKNVIVIVHADSNGRFATTDSKKYLLLGETALFLTQPILVAQQLVSSADSAMRVTRLIRKEANGKMRRISAVEFNTILDVGWIYWLDGKYRWEENPVEN